MKRLQDDFFLFCFSGSDGNNSSPPGGSGAGNAFSPTGGHAAGAAGSAGGAIGGGSCGGGAANSGSAGAGDSSSWMGYFSNVVSVSANYLPSQVTDTLLQGRAFATVHHNLYGFKNICALAV